MADAEPTAHGSRRTVSVLFSDLVGSTALGERLDPELVRSVLARYFAAMAAVIEAHGGTVEKYVGDAIMAVFGLTTTHEDDALRAARAALGMRDRLVALNVELTAEWGITLAARTGIATGEVVTGDPARGATLATGDTINTAARLEQAAGAGEILLGAVTWRLVRDAVQVQAVTPVAAKGKAVPVTAFRLLGLADAAHGSDRRMHGGTPLVGRAHELDRLDGLFAAAARDRRPHLVTVVGPAGVGKSRLVAEAIARLADRATVLRGRCLSYGEGITWWPLRGILHAAAGITEDDGAAQARTRLGALVAGIRDGDIIAARLATAIGLSDEPAPQEELFWAVRRTLESLAQDRPLVVLVEDIHWAEAAMLELLEQVVAHAGLVPLLLVCPARPELRETAPGWGADGSRVTWLELEGLDAAATAALVDAVPGGSALAPDLRARVLATAEGNPLFTEELVRMLVEEGPRAGGDVPLPPTIEALLAARLDALPSGEQGTAQRASVVGRAFEAATIAALTPERARARVAETLVGLERRELVVPEGADATTTSETAEAYRFRHILIRDAAYARLTKAERAELHERFADWLEGIAGDRLTEYETILGHHLERAWSYRTELHDGSGRTRVAGERAGRYLYASGKRARERGEVGAAEALLLRAEALPSANEVARAELLIETGLAQLAAGRSAEAYEHGDRALELATAVGAAAIAARARLLRYDASIALGTFADTDPAALAEVEAALRDATTSGDPGALTLAWSARGFIAYMDGRLTEFAAFTRDALGYARLTGDARVALDLETALLVEAFVGPTPATEVVALGRSMLERAHAWPHLRADVLRLLAPAEAMLGRHEAAEAHALESVALVRDLAELAAVAHTESDLGGWVYRLAGNLPAAEAALRRAHAGAQGIGDPNQGAYVACRMAQLLVAQGRLDEAIPWLEEAETYDVVTNRSRVIGVRARIRAAAGDSGAADDVDRMLALLADSRFLNIRIDALVDAAETMAALGRTEDAMGYATDALRLALAKENLALAGQIEALVARLN